MKKAIVMLCLLAGPVLPSPADMLLVRYGFTIRNPTDRLVESPGFWTHAPMNGPAGLACRSLVVSHDYELAEDAAGQRVLRVRLAPIPPYGVQLVSIEAVLERQEVGPAADPAQYLASREPFAFADEIFVRKGPWLKETPASKKPEALYRWVHDFLAYGGFDAAAGTARQALERERGDCTEYAALYTALCRREGIPARGFEGFVCTGNCILKPTAAHNWAEFYRDGRWHLADPLKRVFRNPEAWYVAMRLMPEGQGISGADAWFGADAPGLEVSMNAE